MSRRTCFAVIAVFGLLTVAPSWAGFEALKKPGLDFYKFLEDPAVERAVRRLAGKRMDEFIHVTSHSFASSVVIEDRYVFAQGCEPRNCRGAGGLLVLDTSSGKVWIAMTTADGRFAEPGAVSTWPKKIRAIVKSENRELPL